MTPEQTTDILTKAGAVPAAKAAYEAALVAHTGALANAASAQAAFHAAVNADDDDTTLTALATQYIATAVAVPTAFAALQAAVTPWQQANQALEDACQAIVQATLNPPP